MTKNVIIVILLIALFMSFASHRNVINKNAILQKELQRIVELNCTFINDNIHGGWSSYIAYLDKNYKGKERWEYRFYYNKCKQYSPSYVPDNSPDIEKTFERTATETKNSQSRPADIVYEDEQGEK